MQATPENVMQPHHALAAAAQLIKLHTDQAIMAKIGEAAKDPVSRPAAEGFNNKRKALFDQCNAYVAALESTAEELARTAQDGVNPCSLLTEKQAQKPSVELGAPGSDDDGLGSQDCTWLTSMSKPDNAWLARTVVTEGAGHYLAADAQIVTVAGFPAVQSTLSDVDPRGTACFLWM